MNSKSCWFLIIWENISIQKFPWLWIFGFRWSFSLAEIFSENASPCLWWYNYIFDAWVHFHHPPCILRQPMNFKRCFNCTSFFISVPDTQFCGQKTRLTQQRSCSIWHGLQFPSFLQSETCAFHRYIFFPPWKFPSVHSFSLPEHDLPFALPQRHSGGHIKHVPKTDGRLASAFAGKTAGRNSCFGGLRLSLRPPGSISEEGTEENKKKYSLKKSARPVFWCHQVCPDACS